MAEDKGLSRSQREEKVLQFWKENRIFEKSLEKEAPEGNFVFYEGPPTANGRPAIHHLEARSFKDAIPRYRTMRGYRVPRKAGWDTHGLPVELEVEKTLGLKSKKEIESYGIAEFNKKCKESVSMYIDEWSKFTDRIGYWVDLSDAYYTYDNSYMEAEWGILSHVEKRGLLYKDYKVVPWCPRCGTALSSHELAQGYQDVKDLSLYVKFKLTDFPNAYFLAWTTTPWTLPGNVALAVGPDITYVEAKVGEEIYVLAKDRLSILTGEYQILAEHKGSEMVGMGYEPLYPFVKNIAPESEKEKLDKAYKVYTADFVTTEDGTGIVHTAVMYGQEDFDLGTKAGLPKVHLVAPDGNFMPGTEWLAGRSVVDETLAVDILKDLQSRGLLFAKENHLHSYPFCWRCKTRLIYYARDSWYIKMSALRDKLVEENQKIHWEPDYIKDGRFGEWLREVKDWAISRERYWGTPLPIWVNDNGERVVVDSLDTLKGYTKSNHNTFIFVRHGEAESNAKDFVNCDPKVPVHLTEKGKEEAKEVAAKIKKVDAIYSSLYGRTMETAEIIAGEKGFSVEKIIKDERIVELGFGDFDGRKYTDFLDYEEKFITAYDVPLPNGESYNDAKKRFGDFLYDIDSRHKNETIVVVTHGMGLEAAAAIIEGADLKRSKEIIDTMSNARTGSMFEFGFTPLPHKEDYALDLHKPYIDDIVLEKDGKEYRRVKEILDVWFDSGSMPFAAQDLFPADFISEGLDQTRGWFYTLHAISTLMESGIAYKNVICLGLLLDKDGRKMSKSVGNVVDPWLEMEKYGADVLRYWMYSINQPGENKNYDDRTVKEVEKRVFNLLDNVYAFYELYRDGGLEDGAVPASDNVLDRWILVRLSSLSSEMRQHLDDYKLLEPTRDLRDFIDDLSTWYLRRSRERLKEGDHAAKKTLYFVLKTVSKLLAPFAPFAAEELYQKLRLSSDPQSVHLEKWPGFAAGESIDISLMIQSMDEVRRLVSLALEARSKANLKIRQPLGKLTLRTEIAPEFLAILADEVNVKQVVVDNSLDTDIVLDTALTQELLEEGEVREAIRSIQELRKEKNLSPKDHVALFVPFKQKDFYEKHKSAITGATNISGINYEDSDVAPHL